MATDSVRMKYVATGKVVVRRPNAVGWAGRCNVMSSFGGLHVTLRTFRAVGLPALCPRAAVPVISRRAPITSPATEDAVSYWHYHLQEVEDFLS